MIIYGIYRWFPKITGFRADFCRSCHCERLALRIRTLDFFFLFWIPVLPLGLWQRWRCSQCGNAPHRAAKTRRAMKIAGMATLLLVSALFWAVPADDMDSEIGSPMIWGFRIVPLFLAAVLLWWILSTGKEPTLNQRLRQVEPLDLSSCPLCDRPLYRFAAEASCGNCGAEHLPLKTGHD